MKKLTWEQIKENCDKGIPMYPAQIPKKYLSFKRRRVGIVTFPNGNEREGRGK